MKYFNSSTLLTSCNKGGCGTCVANVWWLILVNFLIISQKFLQISMISQKLLESFSKISSVQKQRVLALNFDLNSAKFFQMLA